MPVVNVSGVPHCYDLTPAVQPSSRSEVLVCIHGWLLSRTYWQPLMQQLVNYCPSLTYDLRGFGESASAPRSLGEVNGSIEAIPLGQRHSPYSLESYARDLLELLRLLDIQRAWLIGHSLGGSVALWAAHLDPSRIQGVICMNSGGGVYIQSAFEQFRAAGEQMVRYRSHWWQYLPLMPTVFSRLMVKQPLGRAWGKQRLLDFLRANDEAAIGALLASTTCAEVHRLPQLVAGLKQPVYFIAGQQDQVMSPRYVRHLASFHRLFEQGNLFEFENCGHFAMLEQSQQLATVIQQILNQHQAVPLG